MKSTILFNPGNVVNDRNIGIFSNNMPDVNVRGIYNPNFPWFADRSKLFCKDAYYFSKGIFQRPPRGVFDGVDALVLFTAQLRSAPCNLVEEAFLRKVPVIAIEEVSQMMLSQGAMNNYLLPVDHLFAASEYEKDKFLEEGTPCGSIDVVGGVFRYKGPPRKTRVSKKEFGIATDRPVAVISLDLLAPNGETPAMRKEMLTIISDGLGKEYEIIVKPHPIESEESVLSFVSKYLPRAHIAPSRMPIDDVLDAADILFTRGTSQVIIDALQRSIPVIAVPMGRKTVFDDLHSGLAVKSADEVKNAVALIRDKGIGIYDPLVRPHMAITPEDAVKNAVAKLRELSGRRTDPGDGRKWTALSLYWMWMGYPAKAIKVLKNIRHSIDAQVLNAMGRLAAYDAGIDDIILLKKYFSGKYEGYILKSLLIEAAYLRNRRISADDAAGFKDFPPETNRFHFLRFALMLGWLYRNSGMKDEVARLAGLIKASFGAEKGVLQWANAVSGENTLAAFTQSSRTRLDRGIKHTVKYLLSLR